MRERKLKLKRKVKALKQYHRRHPWHLGQEGLFVPHRYDEGAMHELSWWDDVGFILNKRRVIVWWEHPRDVYAREIEDLAWERAGPMPDWRPLSDTASKNFRKVGASRKKLVSYTMGELSPERRAYHKRFDAHMKQLADEGIDMEVRASWRREPLYWATGVSLVVPLEVRSEKELIDVARLARRLLLGEVSLDHEYPDYAYGKSNWLQERKHMRF